MLLWQISNAGESDCPLNSIPTTMEGNVDWSQVIVLLAWLRYQIIYSLFIQVCCK